MKQCLIVDKCVQSGFSQNLLTMRWILVALVLHAPAMQTSTIKLIVCDYFNKVCIMVVIMSENGTFSSNNHISKSTHT